MAPERAVLIGLEVKGSRPSFMVDDSLDELALLAQTAGIAVRRRVTQRVARIDPATFIGSGKLEEIIALLPELDANMVIFDDELSPRHQRELEKALGENVRVIDRSALILDIFAQHARTREGALQVELAQYEYRLPRLTRQWSHLARQAGGGTARGGAGGVGLRGPGETQLEVDRREIRRRISKLKEELEAVRAHRERHRTQRARAGISTVALVGYTNAGKSTLLNALSDADVYVADQLFATLDPTIRRVKLPSNRVVLLSDTADLLLHVVDASHPLAWDHIDVVEDTLAEIEASRVPKVLVLNKIDLGQKDQTMRDYAALGYQAVVRISALQRTGLDDLLGVIDRVQSDQLVAVSLLIPYAKGDLLASIHALGVVEDEWHTAEGVLVKALVPPWLEGHIKRALKLDED
jgi:GTP-binding protein HflX